MKGRPGNHRQRSGASSQWKIRKRNSNERLLMNTSGCTATTRTRSRFLPQAEVMTLAEAASIYAAGRLAEFESRAHYIHDIHSKD